MDLLFAACGIEAEIAQAAEPIEIAAGLVAEVAQVGHLIAMKLVSRDPRRRPRDQQDLVDLASVADDREWQRAEAAIDLIRQRGFSRGRDLRASLAEIRAITDDRATATHHGEQIHRTSSRWIGGSIDAAPWTSGLRAAGDLRHTSGPWCLASS